MTALSRSARRRGRAPVALRRRLTPRQSRDAVSPKRQRDVKVLWRPAAARAAAPALAASAAVVSAGAALNSWPPYNGVLYVPVNAAAAAGVAAAALGPLGLGPTAGLGRPRAVHVVAAGAAGAAAGAILVALAGTDRCAPTLADRRVADLAGGRLAYQVIVRVPVGTALWEEIAFRGALVGLWSRAGSAAATAGPSIAFGLWHVVPTLNLVRANRPRASGPARLAAVAGAVAATTGAAAALVRLRRATGSVWAGAAAHAALNSLATAAGVRAGRRVLEPQR